MTTSPTKPLHPVVAFIGFGVLGKATASAVQQKLSHDHENLTKFLIVDHSFQNSVPIAFYKRSGIHGYQITHLSSLLDDPLAEYTPDIVFVCLPSDQIEKWLKNNHELLTRCYVCVRSTLPLIDYSFLSIEKNGRSRNRYPRLSYVPEFATEQRLSWMETETEHFWALSDSTVEKLRKFLSVSSAYHERGDITRVVAHKLLFNAYLASLYSFNNAAQSLYRQYGIKDPLLIDNGMNAERVMTDKPQSLMVGGKCLPTNLHMLAEGTTSDYWLKLNNLGTGDMSKFLLMVGVELGQAKSRANNDEGVVDLILYGANNNCAHEASSFMYDSPAFWAFNHLCDFQLALAPDTPPRIMLEYASWCRRTGRFIHTASASLFAAFLQPIESRVAQLKDHIVRNISGGLPSLTVFDPLHQFSTRQITALKAFVLSNRSSSLELTFIHDIV